MHLTILKRYLFVDVLDGNRHEGYLPNKPVSNYQYGGKDIFFRKIMQTGPLS